jgi:PAS domain S-box-containing protein
VRRRLLYGSAIALLAILIVVIVWQGSFTFGEFAPPTAGLTYIFWAVSLLIFLLMVTLSFILLRLGLRLYIERRENREGSRIKTKLVAGAMALSVIPLFFMVLFSYYLLNRNFDKWFSRPVESERVILTEMGNALRHEMRDKVQVQAALLSQMPETRLLLAELPPEQPADTSFLARFCKTQELAGAVLTRGEQPTPIASCGAMPRKLSNDIVTARSPVTFGGKLAGYAAVAARMRIDVAAKQAQIERFNEEYNRLAAGKNEVRKTSLLLLSLIALFIMFLATWIALFLSKQISVPISALLKGAEEVSRGNLSHRVDVRALDELAGLVRGFNQMTRELEANSRELDARSRFTEAILESIPTGVISVASDGAIQRVNRALAQIMGQDSVDHARSLDDLFSPEDAAEIRYLMNRARRTGLASRQLDLHTNSGARHLAVTVSALDDKVTSGFVMVIEDTSELLRAQKATAWHEVARRVAHEMKNPLTPIALSAERLARHLSRIDLPPDLARIVHDCTTTIAGEVQSVKNLVDEFSQFARFPAAQPAAWELNEIVESALSVFAGRLQGVEMRTSLAAGLPPVFLDREQFRRVVINLVDNAAEAMQDALVKRLAISTQLRDNSSIELVIADTGCGLSPEQKEKLFLPYFSTKNRGTGLGLAIVSHILTEHNVQIRVEDNQPAGARFVIDIPVIVEAPEPAPEQAQTA